MIEAFFDGICAPINPKGFSACGCLIKRNNRTILKKGFFIGVGDKMSSNVSEYEGFINILKILKQKDLNQEKILIKGDSMMVIEQMKGKWKIIRGLYVEKALEAKELLKDFPNIELQWIPRENNEICDKLAEEVILHIGE